MLMWRLVVTEVHDNIRTYLKKKKIEIMKITETRNPTLFIVLNVRLL